MTDKNVIFTLLLNVPKKMQYWVIGEEIDHSSTFTTNKEVSREKCHK